MRIDHCLAYSSLHPIQLLQGTSIGEVEFIAFSGLKVSSGLPDGPLSEADRKALSGKSQPIVNFFDQLRGGYRPALAVGWNS